jgi:4-hydroxybenzoate polyprenyltransferase
MKSSFSRVFIALLRASHFPQTLAMTVALGVCAWVTGVRDQNLAVFVAAVLFGQFSVGWVNDFIDARLDRTVGRSEKPIVAGALETSSLKAPIAIALILVVPLSILAAGWIGGLAHILAVASAQLYNLYLSRNVWSWLPYAVSFALLPLFVSQAAAKTLWPELPMILLFSLVGVIAHLLNALPDIEIDRKAGKGGLVVSLGRKKSLALTVGLSVVALGVLIYLSLSSTTPAAT